MDYNKLIEQRTKVIIRIEEFLNIDDFSFSVDYISKIHRYLFKKILPNYGEYRQYNIRCNETILNNDSVVYAHHYDIPSLLRDVFKEYKKIDFHNLPKEELLKHLANLTARIWQIHPFNDGNTRTVAVFIQKLLKKIGYQTDSTFFRKNSNYFRNTLVRATYQNEEYSIYPDIIPLTMFLSSAINREDLQAKKEDLIIKELFEVTPKTKKRTRKNTE